MHFRNIVDDDYQIINQRLKNTNYNGCEFSKLYLSSWGFYNYESVQIFIDDNYIFVRFKPQKKYLNFELKATYAYLPPICDKSLFDTSIELLYEQSKEDDVELFVTSLSEEFIEKLGDNNYRIMEMEDFNDYLYNPQDLILFSGKKYHGKRNHISKFDKLYKYDFRDYKKEDRQKVIKLFEEWELKKENYEDEESERYALNVALDMADRNCENIFANVLFVDEKLIGFSLVEITPSNVAIEHIEKADINYDGVYSKLINLTAKKCFTNVRYVNRQEDMGNEGLRKSKLSYHPCRMNKKFFIFA